MVQALDTNREGMMRSLVLTAAALSVFTYRAASQQTTSRLLEVKTCQTADSLLGKLGEDRGGKVQGFYDQARDETWLIAGRVGEASESRSYFRTQIAFFGTGPLRVSDTLAWAAAKTSIVLFILGQVGRDILNAGSLPPTAILLEKSDTLSLQPPQLARYTGPPERALAAIHFDLRYQELLELVRARRIEVQVGNERYEMTPNDRLDIRGLFRIAICTGASSR